MYARPVGDGWFRDPPPPPPPPQGGGGAGPPRLPRLTPSPEGGGGTGPDTLRVPSSPSRFRGGGRGEGLPSQPKTASGRTVRFPFGCRSTTESLSRLPGTSRWRATAAFTCSSVA